MADPLPAVVDDADGHRFTLTVDDVEAELVYRRDGERLVLVHTGVPDAVGGRGIGGALVRHAVGVARDEGLTLAPWCPYARAWLEKHPDEAATTSIDWSPPPQR